MQQQRLDIHKAPASPLRAEPRHPPQQQAGHIQGVDATPGALIRSTAMAAAAAGAILTFAWLPAEYGIDPTGVGRILGLTEMGEIKQQLAAEAAADDAAIAASAGVPVAGAVGDPALVARLDAIEAQLASIAAVVGADRIGVAPAPASETPATEAAPAAEPQVETAAVEEPAAPVWRDEVSYALAPGEGIEVKLVMQEGETAEFEWTGNGSPLNYDTHGDGGGNRISYEQGRAVPDQRGTLTAAFTGNHGWFWRNRTDVPATVTLRTRGDYAEMRAP